MKNLMAKMFQAGEPMDTSTAFRILRIIHLAMCSSVFVDGFLVYLLLTQGIMPEKGFVGDFPHVSMLRTVLWALAAGCVVTIRIIRARFLSVEALRRRATHVAQAINAVHIVMFAVAVSIAIYGLLLFMIGAFLEDFLVLAGLSLLMLYWLRPKQDEYHSLVRAVR